MKTREIIQQLEKELKLPRQKEICAYYVGSRMQRLTELYAGLPLHGTQGYESIGCYSCSGYKKECEVYFNGN